METKLDVKRIENVRRRCGFDFDFEIKLDDFKGKICLAWKNDVLIFIRKYSTNFIDTSINSEDDVVLCQFTGFYSSPNASGKEESWNSLRSLALNNDVPWFMWEDFNEILYATKKKDGFP